MKRLLVPVLDFGLRAARRLRFFPFSLVFVAVGVLLRRIELRRGRGGHLRLDATAADAGGSACAAIVGVAAAPTDLVIDHGAGEGPAAAALFSTALANPAVRSVGFYWNRDALAADLPLWGPQLRDPVAADGAAASPAPRPIPYAGAQREGELLLTRLAGDRIVHVLDADDLTVPEALALAAASPEAMFLDLAGRIELPPGQRPGNLVPLRMAGLGLHQVLALVRVADLYIGTDPVLAAAAPRSITLAALRADAGGAGATARGDGLPAWPGSGETLH